jgi:hypothetical protein
MLLNAGKGEPMSTRKDLIALVVSAVVASAPAFAFEQVTGGGGDGENGGGRGGVWERTGPFLQTTITGGGGGTEENGGSGGLIEIENRSGDTVYKGVVGGSYDNFQVRKRLE